MNRQMTQQPRRSYSFGRRPEWRQPATSFLKVTGQIHHAQALGEPAWIEVLCEPAWRADNHFVLA
jgi:hypothetical protein